jgi:TetR/AcrR family transcriptional regulator
LLYLTLVAAVQYAFTAAAAGPGPGAQRLHQVITAHLRVFAEYPTASRALQFDLGRAARLPDIARSVEASFIGPVTRLLRDGARDNSLRPVEHPRLVAVALLGAVTTVGLNAMTPDHPGSVVELAGVLSDLVLVGLTAKGAA